MRLRSCLVVLATGCGLPACAHGVTALRQAAAAVALADEDAAMRPKEAGRLATWMTTSETLRPVVEAASDYRFEVLLSVPDPAAPRWLSRERFRVDEDYFYPASAIKLAIAVAALEAISERREGSEGVDAHSVLVHDGAGRHGRRVSGASSVATAVDRALVVSDNMASNLLFDFVGSDDLHRRLWRLGLPTVRIRHRLGGARYDAARETPPLALFRSGAAPLRIPARTGTLDLGVNEGALVGDSFVAGGHLQHAPMSFAKRNRIGLLDLQDLLVSIVRPDLHGDPLPRLGEEERALLMSSLEARPSNRGGGIDADTAHEPMLPGLERVVPPDSLHVAGKSGRAYGFLVDNAFVVDLRTQRSFFLSAVVYTNANRRMNDDAYEYESVGFPLFAELGELVASRVFAAEPATAD